MYPKILLNSVKNAMFAVDEKILILIYLYS